MSSTLELANKVVGAKQATDVPKAVRIRDGRLITTNRINTIMFDGLPKDLNCLVDSSDLEKAYKNTSQNRNIAQVGEKLSIKDGKFGVDLLLLDHKDYPIDVDHKPSGKSVAVSEFVNTMKIIAPFLQFEDSRCYLMGGYAYVSDNKFIIRTPLEESFPEFDGSPVTITSDFVDLVTGVERKPVEILVSEDSISMVYDGGFVESTRFNLPAPEGLTETFESWMAEITAEEVVNGEKVAVSKLKELPADVLENLKSMVKIAKPDDKLTFGSMGISLMVGGKASWSINYPMPRMIINAVAIKTVLNFASEFCFDNPGRLAFCGSRIEGFWAAMG